MVTKTNSARERHISDLLGTLIYMADIYSATTNTEKEALEAVVLNAVEIEQAAKNLGIPEPELKKLLESGKKNIRDLYRKALAVLGNNPDWLKKVGSLKLQISLQEKELKELRRELRLPADKPIILGNNRTIVGLLEAGEITAILKNRLVMADIRTLHDLFAADEDHLMEIRGFGKMCLQEVHNLKKKFHAQK